MGTKAVNTILLGGKLLAGISAGYFVKKLTDEKASDMIQEGGALNAFTVGAGQAALMVVAGKIAYWLV